MIAKSRSGLSLQKDETGRAPHANRPHLPGGAGRFRNESGTHVLEGETLRAREIRSAILNISGRHAGALIRPFFPEKGKRSEAGA